MPEKFFISRMENSQTEPTTNTSRPWSASFSLWLSWRELTGRKAVFFINVILVSLLVALPVSLDLMGRAKQSSVEQRIDYIGPSLVLVPKGMNSSDLVTAKFKGLNYSYTIFDKIKNQFSSYLRNAEPRLTERLQIDSRKMPVSGIDFSDVYSYPFSKYSIRDNEVLLGNVASDKLRKTVNDIIRINSAIYTIAGIIPTTGGIEDASVFVQLSVLQKITGHVGQINEIRLFPGSLSSYEQLKSLLNEYDNRLITVDAYRGDTAEKEVDSTLESYQKALYTVAFILIAFCILISTYINLDSRKSEISTVYTLGTSRNIILKILTLRTFWITLLGSLTGQGIALVATVIQADQVPLRYIWSAGPFLEIIAGTIFLGMFITVPFAFYSVYKRDLISHL
jgi:ABC-type antimicrobial peptide transport system permease subunit